MKKIYCAILAFLMLFGITGCKDDTVFSVAESSNTTQSTNATQAPGTTQSSNTQEIVQKDGILFTTEYDVKDYVENAIIVSKNNDLLYGLLDDKGEVVIPIKYDNLEFMNKDNYLYGKDDDIFIQACYENRYTVFDINGKILKGNTVDFHNYINIIDYETEFEAYDTMPFFYEETENNYIFYDKKFNIVKQFPTKGHSFMKFINDKCFLCIDRSDVTDYTCLDCLLYDFDGNLLERFTCFDMPYVYTDKKTNNHVLLFTYKEKSKDKYELNYKYYKATIDVNGTVLEHKEIEEDDYKTLQIVLKSRRNVKQYRLYSSNGTWKLEDLNGNALYDERYYDEFTVRGAENDCHYLKNEDNQLMMINRNGKKCIDYGVLEGESKSSVTMVINDSHPKVQEVFEGKSSIIMTVKSGAGYDIYYFSEK